MHEREYDVDYFLDHLEGVKAIGEGEWMAKCPGHDDRSPSLSVRLGDDGRVLLWCFAGCGVNEITEAIDARDGESWKPTIKYTPGPVTTPSGQSGFGLWMSLFEESVEAFDPFFVGGIERHLAIKPDRIDFLWPSYPSALRYRIANPSGNQKGYYWNRNGLKPPIWPEMEEVVADEIYLTEGESDCLVLRRCGLSAYAITTGGTVASKPRFSSAVLKEFVTRGAKTIYLAFDDDDVGHNTASLVLGQLAQVEKSLPDGEFINIRILPITEIAHPAAGEKDIRQVWLRLRDPQALADAILQLKIDIDAPTKSRFLSLDDYAALPNTALSWLVKDVALRGGIGWISGYPKMGKSFLALDLAISVATRTPFLNHFDVLEGGDVLYVVKENSDASLVNRLIKISAAKKSFDVKLWSDGKPIATDDEGPGRVLIDPTRAFRFEPAEVEALIHEIEKYTSLTGRKVKMILIDPLSFALPAGKFELNSFTDVQSRIVDPIAHMIRRTGASVFVVHHQSKGEGNSMLGSIATEASFDNKISFLTKSRGIAEYTPGDPVLLQIAHRDGSVFSIEVKFSITDDTYGVSVQDVDSETVKQALSPSAPVKVSYLDKQKQVAETIVSVMGTAEWKYPAIIDAMMERGGEWSRSLIENTVIWMTRQGQIISPKRGTYAIGS